MFGVALIDVKAAWFVPLDVQLLVQFSRKAVHLSSYLSIVS